MLFQKSADRCQSQVKSNVMSESDEDSYCKYVDTCTIEMALFQEIQCEYW